MALLQLPEDATLEHAAALALTLPAAVAGGSGPLSVDASGVRAFDSSTIALLMQAGRLAAAAGRSVQVQGAPEGLVGLARLYGVDTLLPLAGRA